MHAALHTGSLPARRRGARLTRRMREGVLLSAAIATAGVLLVAPAHAEPIPGIGTGSAAAATEPTPQANFAPPSINIADGEVVGVAQPIIITFKEPVTDHATAEKAIQITSSKPVPGHFYWRGDKQVRWRPNDFWPDNTDVQVQAGGTTSSFRIGDAFVATADDETHTITVTRNGEVVREMPTSMGKPKHETPNGIYIVGEQQRKMIMDSSTYGVPITDPEGYKLEVEYATRISNSGIFVHAAPWSVAQQGVSNASHGCLNVSTEDGKWFFENARRGDPVIVQNTQGGTLSASDGLGDWN
ncbi:L,D-transpeptidase [Streptomyces gardneri]|uniref:L,D-transpeptidase n=1 Tax=Nocardia TaxID=1817 RepID=UPI001356E054|nr:MULTISPECIES: L,D-transpeptidase [Nocardia]MBF6164542.1 L,D-transpeptidase [Streptomyces gardneri]MBF6203933.1 L,D-transpeptidase [Streptomyces gardneri]UAK33942.1 L,D-transpeptidase [Nocardia asteroides]